MNGPALASQVGLFMLAGLWLVAAGTAKRRLEWKRHDDAERRRWRRPKSS